MSGCPVRQVRHIYKNRGLVTNYSTIGGICRICPPLPPPPPPPPPRPPVNIRVAFQSAVPFLFSVTLLGNGNYDSGNGILVPFSLDSPTVITMTVQPGNTVLFYSTDIVIFQTVGQPVSLLDISNCPTLTTVICNQGYLVGAFDISTNQNINEIQFLDTLITEITGVISTSLRTILLGGAAFTQATADELANYILTNGLLNGFLDLSNQSTGAIDITGFLYTTLIDDYGWSIYN